MKTRRFFFVLGSFALSLLFLVACGDEAESYDGEVNPVKIYFAVRDADGNDLLDKDVEGNLLGQEIKAVFQGQEYKLNETEPVFYPWITVFKGLRLVDERIGGRDEGYLLCFGELLGSNVLDNEPLTLDLGDGRQELVTIYNRVDESGALLRSSDISA